MLNYLKSFSNCAKKLNLFKKFHPLTIQHPLAYIRERVFHEVVSNKEEEKSYMSICGARKKI